jgi:hypothetical protein
MAILQSLPSELLQLIAEVFIETQGQAHRTRSLITLTSICSELRLIFVSLPHLWTHIDFKPRSDEWNALCMARSLDQPLCVTLVLDPDFLFEWEILADSFSKAHYLLVDIDYASDRWFWKRFKTTDIRRTQTLTLITRIRSSSTDRISLDMNVDSLLQATDLTRLTLHNIDLDGLPCLPSLRKLKFRSVSVLAQHLYDSLAGSPLLKQIDMSWVKVRKTVELSNGTAYRQCGLSVLKTLVLVGDDSKSVLDILDMIPNPSFKLDIRVDHHDVVFRVAGPNLRILERVEQFRTNALASTPSVTTFVIIANRMRHMGIPTRKLVEIAAKKRKRGPSVTYCWTVRAIPSDPVIEGTLETVRISCRGDTHELGLDIIDSLESLQTMVIVEEPDAKACDWSGCADALEQWLLARLDKGRPLKRIEFWTCRNGTQFRVLHDRLIARQAAETITWKT